MADCGRCRALCCVAPAFAASADFAIDKAAGHACPNLRSDDGCGIHDRLRERGFPGCVAYDCFGAGQQVVQVVFAGAPRSRRMLRAYEVARQLHELLFYAADALAREDAAPVHAALARARAAIEARLTDPDALESTDPAAHRAEVAPLLRRASILVRTPPDSGSAPDLAGPDPTRANHSGADLDRADPPRANLTPADRAGAGPTGPDLTGRNLSGPDLAGADPTGRDLTGPDLAGADPTGRDLTGADLAGRDLTGRDLRRVDLSRASLLGASLLGADLTGADLRAADLLAADLRGADLTGADLTGALYLTRTQVGGTRGDATTRLPAGLPRPPSWPT